MEETKMKEVDYYQILIALMIFIGFVMVLCLTASDRAVYSTTCYDVKGFEETITKIEKNCGSTFLAHAYGKSGWSVFKDSDYVSLDSCIGG
jgi:hypothetical protein